MNDNSIESKIVLTYIFTGTRPNELLNLHKSQIHIDEISADDGNDRIISYIITGSKTDAGKNRCIPIHGIIKPFFINAIKELQKFNTVASYRTNCFLPLMNKLKLTHLPYDTRHTFATLAKLYNVDEYCRKKIMGHKSSDITDDIYTHSIYNQLFKEINKIKI